MGYEAIEKEITPEERINILSNEVDKLNRKIDLLISGGFKPPQNSMELREKIEKEKKGIYHSYEIGGGDDKYRLTALVTDTSKYPLIYEMPSFEINPHKHDRHSEIAFWDNEYYLLPLLSYLRDGEISGDFKPPTQKEIPTEDYPLVIAMLEEGERLGFFNNAKK